VAASDFRGDSLISFGVTGIGPFVHAVLRASMEISAPAIALATGLTSGHLGRQRSHAPGRSKFHLVPSSRRPWQAKVIFAEAQHQEIAHQTYLEL
jgi:hypothetical protein